ncbi:MAG: F0F1 ATP synthase subunit B [Eggerthellaceae bacterium]|nr:F0F1 ATP synthase subunit B [Eggerthellaceae bacterium]
MKVGAKKAWVVLGAVLLSCCMVLAFPALAFAAEDASGSTSGIAAILPNMEEFIPMVICFVILFIVLARVGWPKFAAMIDKREAAIKDSLEKSEVARAESEKLLEEHKKQLEESKALAAQIIADAKKTGESLRVELSEKAQREADAFIVKAKAAIEAEKLTAIADLQGSVADASIAIAARLIGSDLTDEEHRKIIERYVNEAGSFNAN